jgi:hypothetical protein
MITAYDVIAALRNPLAQDSALQTWCLANYHRRQIVSVGWDHTKDPTDADCPLIVLRPGGEAGGEEARTNDVRVVLNLAIWDGRTKSDAPAGTRTPECLWVENLPAFSKLVWTAVKTAMATTKYRIGKVNTDYDDSHFPLVQTAGILSLSALQCLGAAEPTL